jgi:membrane protein YdbS with pleckstrin-like domain
LEKIKIQNRSIDPVLWAFDKSTFNILIFCSNILSQNLLTLLSFLSSRIMVEREWRTLDYAAKKVWKVKGIIIFGMVWIFLSLGTLLGWFYTPLSDPNKEIPLWIFLIETVTLVSIFIVYNIWIVMYFPRYKYALGEEGILINRGIWWKYRRTIPYSRVQHISVDQGPIEQMFHIYRVNSYTAGTGSMGGASAGSGVTGPEGQILGVKNPEPLKEEIMKRVMHSRLGDGVSDIGSGGTSKEILEELRAIRKGLEKK